MKLQFAVNPDDYTIEFVTGDDVFFDQFTSDLDIESLDDLITNASLNGEGYNGHCVFDDVYDQQDLRLTISSKTYSVLESLDPEDQQAILVDIVKASLGDFENVIPYAKRHEPGYFPEFA